MASRIRTTLDFASTVQPHAATYDNGVYIWPFNGYGNYLLPRHFSYIRDVVGARGQNNPVNQVVVDLFTTGYPPIVVSSNGHVRTFTPSEGIFVPSSVGRPLIENWPWIPSISAATLSDWSLGAFSKFTEQVPTKVSLANFLYELKDIKGMIPSIDRLNLRKSVSNNFLGFEFGTMPFISDIQTIVGLSDAVDKRLKHLIEVNRKTTDVRFDRSESLSDPFSFFISNDDPSKNNYSNGMSTTLQGLVFRRLSCNYIFHIGGKLTQDLKDLEDSNAKLKGLIAAGGFNHPGRVIWNAIPYSFVVDWFFSLGKLIDTLAIQPYEGEYSTHDVMWSLKSTADYEVLCHWTPGFTESFVSIGTARVKIYERYNGFPTYCLALTNGTLTPMQQVLGLAMLNQRL